jgi:hypothetical protein
MPARRSGILDSSDLERMDECLKNAQFEHGARYGGISRETSQAKSTAQSGGSGKKGDQRTHRKWSDAKRAFSTRCESAIHSTSADQPI